MTVRVSKGPIIDQLSDKLRTLKLQEYKTKMNNELTDAQKEKYLLQIQDEMLKVKKQMSNEMLKEKLKRRNKTASDLNIRI